MPVFDEMRSVLEAATRGCGLAYVFEQFAAREIKSGALVAVLEKFSPPSEAFHLYYPGARDKSEACGFTSHRL